MTEAKHSPLESCPFCQNPLTSKVGRINPYARCITPECFGSKMPVVNLDVQSDVIAWNTRAPTSLHAELVAALDNILSAKSKFRSALPPDWEGDPLHDACEAARAIVQKARQK